MRDILQIHLLSDACFGRGDGVAGVVNADVEQDARTGLPIIKGRTLKGLLVEAAADLLYSLSAALGTSHSTYTTLDRAAGALFGDAGSGQQARGLLHVGTAALPPSFQKRIVRDNVPRYERQTVLEMLTTIHYQTAIDAEYGTPDRGSLRAMRVVLRKTVFVAPLVYNGKLEDEQKAFLAACIATTRRGGLSRNRGRGRLALSLAVAEWDTKKALERFEQMVRP